MQEMSKEIEVVKQMLKDILLSEYDVDISMTSARLKLIEKNYPDSYDIAFRVAISELKHESSCN